MTSQSATNSSDRHGPWLEPLQEYSSPGARMRWLPCCNLVAAPHFLLVETRSLGFASAVLADHLCQLEKYWQTAIDWQTWPMPRLRVASRQAFTACVLVPDSCQPAAVSCSAFQSPCVAQSPPPHRPNPPIPHPWFLTGLSLPEHSG